MKERSQERLKIHMIFAMNSFHIIHLPFLQYRDGFAASISFSSCIYSTCLFVDESTGMMNRNSKNIKKNKVHSQSRLGGP